MLMNSKSKEEIDSTAIEERCLELKGISACLILAHDAQVDGPHENGDRMAEASYFLGLRIRRLAEEMVTLAYPGRAEQAMPYGDRVQHETAKSLLREIFFAWKAFHDAGEDDDSPIGEPLWERARAAEIKLREWKSDEPAVWIAKLIASKTGEIHRDLESPADDAMAADAALNGLRWFGLEDLYNESWPVDAAKSKDAPRGAETTS
jgi:hypothetical protein